MTDWKKYEEVSRVILAQFKKELGLIEVEGKQLLVGKESGTEWEVDAKGVQVDGVGFVIIEARQYRKSRQNQAKVAALAYQVKDTGAAGGIVVSPLGLQEGAEKVAKASNIVSVRINAECTPSQFSVELFGNVFIKAGIARISLSTKAAAIKSE